MLPTLLAQDTREQVISFLETTFSFRDDGVWTGLQQFLDPKDGLSMATTAFTHDGTAYYPPFTGCRREDDMATAYLALAVPGH